LETFGESGKHGGRGDAARLRSLLDIAKVVGATRRFEDLIELTAEEARRALDASSLSVSRWDRETGVLRTLVNVGLLGPGEARFPHDETYSVSQWPQAFMLVEEGHAFISTVDGGDEDEQATLLRQLGKDSSISVPIVVEARVWGEMWATRAAAERRFDVGDIDFAIAVATQVAAGVVQADHFARIERLAFEDPLTGLANRRAIDERLEECVKRHIESGESVSLVLADINRLKQVNDSFGHSAGDRLIVAVGDAVSRASGLASGSLAARIGGDEFCIVLAGTTAQAAVEVAQELCDLVDRQPMSTGVSCGVASTETMAGRLDSPVRLFRLADAAQYRAKRSGARHPVVAGHPAPEAPVESPVDRRARRGRLAIDGEAALDSGLELLDRCEATSTVARAEVVAEHVRELMDAAAWWVSHSEPESGVLRSICSSVARHGDELDAEGRAQAEIGASFTLADFPVSELAIREAGAFHVELGAPENDPAEEAFLVTAGYTGLVAAGATGHDGGWLVEVFTDPISLPVVGFEPVLRSLLAVAVAGSATSTDDGPASSSDRTVEVQDS
jgi:diguanylate cyclase (GGDEF)-like protein